MLPFLERLSGLHLAIPLALLLAAWPARKLSLPPVLVTVTTGAIAGVIALLVVWLTARSHPNAIAGLIPWNDAAGYLSCARQLVAGAEIDAGCSMRPYYTAFFGTILGVAGGYFQLALLLQAALLWGISAWFSHVIARQYGNGSGLVCFSLLAIYNTYFALVVLTEVAGLILGLLSISLLFVQGTRISRFGLLVAMMVLTLALIARAGAILVIPFLLAWAFLQTTGGLRERGITIGVGIVGIVLAIVANLALTWLFGSSVAKTQTNFAYTLYAMSVNSSTYLQILTDHPELTRLSPEQFTSVVFHKAWTNIATHPNIFFRAYIQAGLTWGANWFSFIPIFPVRALFFASWLLGVGLCLRRWRGACESLLLTALAGTVLSVPFLHPFGGDRILAATFPIDLIFAAIGVSYLFKPQPDERRESSGTHRWSVAIAILALAPILIAALLRHLPVLQPSDLAISCPGGATPLIAEFGRESVSVGLVENRLVLLMHPLEVRRTEFVKRLSTDLAHREHLAALPAGTSLIDAMQRFPLADGYLRYGRSAQILWDGELPRGIVRACIKPVGDGWLPYAFPANAEM